MPKFFQSETAAYGGDKNGFQNVKFKQGDLHNSPAAEAGSILEIIPVHYPNPPVIQFIAYLTNLDDRYNVKYTAEQPYGRTNPYHIWGGNDRSISVGLDIPSSGISNGLDNLNNLSWLLSSLYPTYKDSTTATSVAATPLFRVRYANLIVSSTNNGQGLLCTINDVNVSHQLDNGFLQVNPKNVGSSFANAAAQVLSVAKFENSLPEGKNILIPKLMKITLSLSVVHDHALGWDFHTGDFRGGVAAPSFPHNFGTTRNASDAPQSGQALFETASPPNSPGETVVAAATAEALGDQSQ
jgi:hypothetical protein